MIKVKSASEISDKELSEMTLQELADWRIEADNGQELIDRINRSQSYMEILLKEKVSRGIENSPKKNKLLQQSLKRISRAQEPVEIDNQKTLEPSAVLRLVTSKLALPIGIALAVGVSMLFLVFDGNVRRRGGFYHALVSMFGQQGTAIVLGLFLGGLVFWWLNDLDEEIPSHQKEQMKKLVNLRFLSGENYNKIILTGIFLVLIVIAFLLS